MENAPSRNGLAVTSMVLGILSLMMILMGLALPVGALGIITALLSRGSGEMNRHAKIGLAVSLLAIALGFCVLIYAYRVINSAEFAEILKQYEELYGVSVS